MNEPLKSSFSTVGTIRNSVEEIIQNINSSRHLFEHSPDPAESLLLKYCKKIEVGCMNFDFPLPFLETYFVDEKKSKFTILINRNFCNRTCFFLEMFLLILNMSLGIMTTLKTSGFDMQTFEV